MSLGNSRVLAALGVSAFSFMLVTSSCGGGGTGVPPSQATSRRFLTITTAQLKVGAMGKPYAYPMAAQGGSPPLTWMIALGSLPPGISLDSRTGMLSGTPSKSGSFAITIEAVDSTLLQREQALASFILEIIPPPLTIVTSALPPGTPGKPYAFTLRAIGGVAPYFWSVMAGELPAGLQLDPLTGELAGTPSSPGTFEFTIQVMDSSSPQNMATLSVASLPRPWGG